RRHRGRPARPQPEPDPRPCQGRADARGAGPSASALILGRRRRGLRAGGGGHPLRAEPESWSRPVPGSRSFGERSRLRRSGLETGSDGVAGVGLGLLARRLARRNLVGGLVGERLLVGRLLERRLLVGRLLVGRLLERRLRRRRLAETLQQSQRTLVPWDPVRDAGRSEPFAVREVPVVGLAERLLVREAGFEA